MNFKLSREQENALLEKFERRANTHNWKGKKRKDMQVEFLLGAVSAIDTLNGNNGKSDDEKTCIPPGWMIDIMRGDYVMPQ